MILSVTIGVQLGAWLNYQMGVMSQPELSQPYTILWPSMTMAICTVIRTVIGFTCVFLTMKYGKKVSYSFLCALLREDADHIKKSANTVKNKHKTFVELGCKYFQCFAVGFNTMYVLPPLFRFLHIERPTFYTEI